MSFEQLSGDTPDSTHTNGEENLKQVIGSETNK